MCMILPSSIQRSIYPCDTPPCRDHRNCKSLFLPREGRMEAGGGALSPACPGWVGRALGPPAAGTRLGPARPGPVQMSSASVKCPVSSAASFRQCYIYICPRTARTTPSPSPPHPPYRKLPASFSPTKELKNWTSLIRLNRHHSHGDQSPPFHVLSELS